MSQRGDIKKLVLKLLLTWDSRPAPDHVVLAWVKQGVNPTPTVAEVSAALRELETDQFISGATDELDKTVSWTLTTKGQHKARQLD